VDDVWEFISYIANSLLFLLLGIQISNSHLGTVFGPLLWAIAGVIVGRALMIFLLLTLQNGIAHWYAHRRRSAQKSLRSSIMPVPRSWRPIILLSGLRGALSLALVLSLPQGIPNSSLFEFVTYGVVLITLLGQGIAMRAILPRWSRRHEQVESASATSLPQS
jgi:CPA1 family monovalent cation:H+ antiporter